MILLDIQNRAIEELLLWKFESAKSGSKPEKTDQTIADFDGVIFRVHNHPDDRSKLLVSVWLTSFGQLEQAHVYESLSKEYGPYLCSEPEADATVSLLYDLNALPDDYSRLAQQASLLRRHCFAGLFSRFLDFHALGEEAVGVQRAVFHYRPNESIYVQAQGDRITVIFSTIFKDPNDIVISKLFLQELAEARRRIDRAPQVLFSQTTPPGELLGTDAVMGDNVAYVTFVFFPRHLTPTNAPRTINLIHSFRNYLHYHLKCSKSYIHRRIGAKTAEFLKILNRARLQCLSMPVIQVDSPLINRFSQTAQGLPNGDTNELHDSLESDVSNGFVTAIECMNGDIQ